MPVIVINKINYRIEMFLLSSNGKINCSETYSELETVTPFARKVWAGTPIQYN